MESETISTDLAVAASRLVDAWRMDAAGGDMETIHELVEALASALPNEHRSTVVSERFVVALEELVGVSRLALKAADAIVSLTDAMGGINTSVRVIREELQQGLKLRVDGHPSSLPPPASFYPPAKSGR